MKKRLVPDWLFKSFLVVAAWALTITAILRLVLALLRGQIDTLGGRTIFLDHSPVAYAGHIGLSVFASLCLLSMAILTLGFIPIIGRVYKRLYFRLLA